MDLRWPALQSPVHQFYSGPSVPGSVFYFSDASSASKFPVAISLIQDASMNEMLVRVAKHLS